MRRVVRFIAGLYPRAWRERYGREFAALLGEVNPSFATVVNVLGGAIAMQVKTWSFSRMLAISVLCGVAAFAVMFYLVPHTYRSAAVVRLTGLASEQSRVDYVNEVAREAMSQVLTNVINSDNLYLQERSRLPMEQVIAQMKKHLHISLLASDSHELVFVIAFDDLNGRTAQKVVKELTSRFATSRGTDVNLEIRQSADLPNHTIRNTPALVTASALISAFGLGMLSLLRWRSLKKA